MWIAWEHSDLRTKWVVFLLAGKGIENITESTCYENGVHYDIGWTMTYKIKKFDFRRDFQKWLIPASLQGERRYHSRLE